MTSVVRRVLDVPDTTAVVDYFEETDSRLRPRRGRGGAIRARRAAHEPAPRSLARHAVGARRRCEPHAARKKWTVMVWMAGDNDLEEFGDKDIAEMKRVGSTDDVNVVVQLDSMRDDNTRRYFVAPAASPTTTSSRSSARPTPAIRLVATDFFRWAIERYPAERLLGVIWNHGTGIDDTDVYRRPARRGAAGAAGGNGARAGASRGGRSRAVIAAPCSRPRSRRPPTTGPSRSTTRRRTFSTTSS